MPKKSLKNHRDYSVPTNPKRRLSTSSSSSISSSSSSGVAISRSFKNVSPRKKSGGSKGGKSKKMYLVQDRKRPSSGGQQPQFTIIMKPAGMDIKAGSKSRSSSSSSGSRSSSRGSGGSSSASDNDGSGSSSGRGRTRKIEDRSSSSRSDTSNSSRSGSSSSSNTSSSSNSNSSGDSLARRKRQNSHSPATIIRIEPVIFDEKPSQKGKEGKSAKKKLDKTSPRKDKSPAHKRRGQSAPHKSQQNAHSRRNSHSARNEFTYKQQQQMGQSEPIQQIIVENCEPEFETCPHVGNGETPNKNNCQSSVVLRHVCLKCQRNLDKGKTIVRRNSISGSANGRRSSQEKIRTPSGGVPMQQKKDERKPKTHRKQQKSRSKSPKSNGKKKQQKSASGNYSNDSSSEDEQIHIGNGEIFANRAFMKSYHLHRRFESDGKNKACFRPLTSLTPFNLKNLCPITLAGRRLVH